MQFNLHTKQFIRLIRLFNDFIENESSVYNLGKVGTKWANVMSKPKPYYIELTRYSIRSTYIHARACVHLALYSHVDAFCLFVNKCTQKYKELKCEKIPTKRFVGKK